MTLARQLGTLESSGLIRVAQVQPELEYLFRHALVQEAAYESLLKHDRRRLHLTVGECLERLYPDRLDELAPVLGLHFYEAGEDERALKYSTMAADAAFTRSANSEAADHYRRALEVARRQDAGSEQIIHLHGRYGRTLELSGAYDEALSLYDELEKLGAERNDSSMELAALMLRATVHAAPTSAHDHVKAEALSERALIMARELGDRRAEAKVLWNLMLLNSQSGQLSEALRYGEQSLALARELNLREQLAYTLNDIWSAYWAAGQAERAEQAQREARELWQELRNLPMLVDSLAGSAGKHVFSGEFEQGIALAEEARRISEEIGSLWGQSYSRYMVGYAYLERGNVSRGIEAMEECIRLAELAGFLGPQLQMRADLAVVYASLGDVEHGFDLARQALDKAEEFYPAYRPWIMAAFTRLHLLNGNLEEAEATFNHLAIDAGLEELVLYAPIMAGMAEGELALARGDHAHAVKAMDRLIETLRRGGIRLLLSEALYLKAKALLEQGNRGEAREVLEEARAEAEAVGSRRMLWQILFALSQIEAGHGNNSKAKRLRARARETLHYIVDHISRPELRTSFLNLPNVREVLGA